MIAEKERRLLRELSDIPITEKPFKAIAERLRVSEEWVLKKVKELMESGAIRRFGLILNHFRAGFPENALLLWRSDDPMELGAKFAALPWVSHCYRRNSYPQLDYQLYTMVHARTREELLERIDRMREMAGSEPLVLLTKRCFKKSSFEV